MKLEQLPQVLKQQLKKSEFSSCLPDVNSPSARFFLSNASILY